jgi:hypothetical protein
MLGISVELIATIRGDSRVVVQKVRVVLPVVLALHLFDELLQYELLLLGSHVDSLCLHWGCKGKEKSSKK